MCMKAILGVLLVGAFALDHAAAVGFAPLYRYWNDGSDHFYTININEIGTAVPGAVGNFKYKSEGIQCIVATDVQSDPNLVPLYRYWNGKDHFYTANASEIDVILVPGVTGKFGYTYEGIAAYCGKVSGGIMTLPLYRYWNGAEHFYTTNADEIGTTTPGQTGRFGYRSEGIACYVAPYGAAVCQ